MTHLFEIKSIGEGDRLHDFELNIQANENEMEWNADMGTPEFTFKIISEPKKDGDGRIVWLDVGGKKYMKTDLFKINGLNPTVKSKLEGEYCIRYITGMGGGKRNKSKRNKSKYSKLKKRKSRRRKTKRSS